jgi:hypothetical protein
MGKIAEALRANLRELAQSDARSLRALDAELKATRAGTAGRLADQKPPAGQLSDGLDKLTVAELKNRCKARGLKLPGKARKVDLVSALRNGVPSTFVVSRPVARVEGGAERLDRIEALLCLIAEHVGVNAAEIEKVLRS